MEKEYLFGQMEEYTTENGIMANSTVLQFINQYIMEWYKPKRANGMKANEFAG